MHVNNHSDVRTMNLAGGRVHCAEQCTRCTWYNANRDLKSYILPANSEEIDYILKAKF